MAKIEAEEAREMKKIQSAKTFGDKSKIFKTYAAALVAVAGVVASVACPPALIFLPMALPLITLVTEALEKKVNMKIAGESHPKFLSAFGLMRRIIVREMRVQNCQDALETLNQATSDLAQLDKCIDEFASFWTSVKGLLDHVMGRVEGLRDSQALRMRLKSIRSTWVVIAESYQDYVVKVSSPFHGLIPILVSLKKLSRSNICVRSLCFQEMVGPSPGAAVSIIQS